MNPEDSLNGCVQSQGVRVSIENWLVMGSPEWDATPDEIKAYAYQAAVVTGWSDNALRAILVKKCPYMDDGFATVVIDTLRDLAVQHPLEVEDEKANRDHRTKQLQQKHNDDAGKPLRV